MSGWGAWTNDMPKDLMGIPVEQVDSLSGDSAELIYGQPLGIATGVVGSVSAPMVETTPPSFTPDGIEGWFDFKELYDEMVVRFVSDDGARFAEVGCWAGASTGYLARRMKQHAVPFSLRQEREPLNVHLFAVDTWLGSYDQPDLVRMVKERGGSMYPTFMRNMSLLGVLDVVRAIQGPSVWASQLFPDGYFDFVFIDACHAYDSVKADILAWLPKVRKGGILAGHDYRCETHPDVTRAVNELLRNADSRRFRETGSCWVWEV